MEKRAKPVRKISKRHLNEAISLLLIAAAMFVTYMSVLLALTPKRYDVAIGADAPETVYAPRSVVDETATKVLKERASQNVQPVYRINDDKVGEQTTAAADFFAAVDAVRTKAYELTETSADVKLAADKWSAALNDEKITTLSALVPIELSRDEICTVLGASSIEIQLFEDIVFPKITTALSAGLAESGVESVKDSCVREVNRATGLSAALKKIAAKVFDEYMTATYEVDETATFAAREAAAETVADVVIKKNEIIVEKGAEVTESKYALLTELELVRAPDADVKLDLGLLLYVAVIFVLLTVYLKFMRREVYRDRMSMIILASMIALSALLALLCNSIEPLMSPALIGIMLCALLISDKIALAVSALLAVTVGLMAGGRGSTMFEYQSLVMCVAIMASGIASVLSLKRVQSRGAIIAAGAVGGGAASIVMIAFDIIKEFAAARILTDVVWALGSSLISALLVVGSLSIWESLFDVATTARLNELSNTNHPLLKRLMIEAPGTYQHSMMVAALAEGAAQHIGADALLARVGGYFHDVGKLMKPLYFKENQKPNENIHDTLPPQESAMAIIAHQKDGVRLLIKYKLPSAIIKIASEHHGNSLMVYFYHKAQTQAEGREVNIKNFKYSGNKPSTKESAVVMLADSCEAAVRSLGDTDKAKVEEMVHKIIWGKIEGNENLLSNAPLTLSEMSEIEKSFLKTFNGIMHDRIEYPELEGKSV